MVAIETRYLSQTNHKPARIVAETSVGHRLVVSRWAIDKDHQEDVHKEVAEMLRDKCGWTGKLIGGATKKGYCFVFVS